MTRCIVRQTTTRSIQPLEDLFNRVQERMEKNRHAPAMAEAKEDYLLTTKLFCGKCERMMVE